jgi:hypothetical protein
MNRNTSTSWLTPLGCSAHPHPGGGGGTDKGQAQRVKKRNVLDLRRKHWPK